MVERHRAVVNAPTPAPYLLQHVVAGVLKPVVAMILHGILHDLIRLQQRRLGDRHAEIRRSARRRTKP